MNSVSKWMVNPWQLLKEFTKPFIYIVGGFAALTAFFHVLFGQDPVGPVLWFLSGSVEALAPLAVKLAYIWLFYTACYLLVGVYLRDLWRVFRVPELIGTVSRRRGFSFFRRMLPDRFFCWPQASALGLLLLWPNEYLSARWTAGLSPQIE